MTKFLVRVDDVGRRFGDDPKVGTDSHLLDAEAFVLPFRRAGVPLVLGCVPAWLQPSAMDFLWQQVKGNENVLAVHGWDHAPGKVSVDRMRAGIQLLTRDGIVPSVYIPPFNSYSPQDVDAWGDAGGTVFLGGLDGSDHLLGSLPRQIGVRKVWHAPYRKLLYGLSHDLVSQVVGSGAEDDRVEVLTLHVPWEVRARTGWLNNLTALAQSLVGRCVTISEAVKHWSKMSHG
jgi:hypothetical protein